MAQKTLDTYLWTWLAFSNCSQDESCVDCCEKTNQFHIKVYIRNKAKFKPDIMPHSLFIEVKEGGIILRGAHPFIKMKEGLLGAHHLGGPTGLDTCQSSQTKCLLLDWQIFQAERSLLDQVSLVNYCTPQCCVCGTPWFCLICYFKFEITWNSKSCQTKRHLLNRYSWSCQANGLFLDQLQQQILHCSMKFASPSLFFGRKVPDDSI